MAVGPSACLEPAGPAPRWPVRREPQASQQIRSLPVVVDRSASTLVPKPPLSPTKSNSSPEPIDRDDLADLGHIYDCRVFSTTKANLRTRPAPSQSLQHR